ncbi:MAG: UDP-N-acetylmuramoyl-tripeptide--D-alanyl-D-alanine ligase [Desulfovibrio sp.]
MKLTLHDLELSLSGQSVIPNAENIPLNAARTDSREVQKGDVFFCIKGERVDGHDYAAKAAANGAAVIVAQKNVECSAPVVVVEDAVKALGLLAAEARKRFSGKFIAITGTAGKTTVKEMLERTLRSRFSIARNPRNLNNQIGLPLSILAASGDEHIWLMELGISQPHDMNELGAIAMPDIAIIHNVGAGHLEGLGSIKGVALAKASLLKYLQPDGQAFVNQDYKDLFMEARKNTMSVIPFSTQDETVSYFCSFNGHAESCNTPEPSGSYTLRTPQFHTGSILPYCGSQFAENIAAVLAVSTALGLSEKEIICGLEKSGCEIQRFQAEKIGQFTLIDDTYNANPLSMSGAIRSARSIAGEGQLIVVAGEMRELGSETLSAHKELGEFANSQNAVLIFEGESANAVKAGFGNSENFFSIDSAEGLKKALSTMQLLNGCVLVKGSRSMKMERYLPILREELKEA